MRKIIKGKLYNTETADKLANYVTGEGYDRLRKTLYKTKKGAYFIHYFGGAATSYGKQLSYNLFTSDSGLILVDEDEAKEFIDKYSE